ncbi:CS1 type fimbrial major subunit [Pseudomonas fluorescens]|uniref:CS1 type fimbrial major subunit n=2 Tax=Pseudomonas fluorescens TaxID=294 RepID=A0ABY1TBU1_PSEFL|nr:CS1 type fimbrial major subunit [Pseudomonas fluorescens]MCI4604629.1 fimbrial protein [Pseudomonas fluorescens]PQB00765.1 hypothetical protein B0A76_10980 [Pseudomonas fluorescens]RFP94451.1 adhesin [Pseudomonas fluorescens]RMO76665.1 hypothetical protein ALQ35_200043 [Pseudomonas fluorescens]SNY10046.1 CS1 type fimbrial major subunit [Pseudomonas fluorescens]
MFKKFAVSLPLVFSVLGSSAVFAAGEATSHISIKAVIPSTSFNAQPLNPNFGLDEVMNYNVVTGELSELSAPYILKNSAGSIQASLRENSALLSNGSVGIPLTVKLGDVTLDTTAKEVVSVAQAKAGIQKNLSIKTTSKPKDGETGSFIGEVVIIFDNVVAPQF